MASTLERSGAAVPAAVPEEVLRQEDALEELANAPRYAAWLFGRCRPYLGARTLDFGAGIGTYTALAAQTAEEVVALEPESRFVARLADRFAVDEGIEIVQLGAADLEPDSFERPFDSIVCLNVLEHIAEDVDTLARFRAQLRPGGRLLLLVPAHPSLYGPIDAGLRHIRRYGKAELREKLAHTGFTVRTLSHVNPVGAGTWLFYVRLLRRPSLGGHALRAFDKVVPAVRWLDALRLPFGLSLWAVAERAVGEHQP